MLDITIYGILIVLLAILLFLFYKILFIIFDFDISDLEEDYDYYNEF